MSEATDNIREILRHIYSLGPTPRSQLAQLTGLTEAAVSRISRKLIGADILREGGKLPKPGRVGRRLVELEFGKGAYVAAIGIRAYKQWVQVATLEGHALGQRTFQIDDTRDAKAVLERCCVELKDLISELRIPTRCVLGVSVAVVGVVDHLTGTVLTADALGWDRTDVAAFVQDRLELPVCVESFFNALNLLLNGLPQPSLENRNVAVIVVAMGIAASFIMNGQLLRGGAFGAGQIGHLPVEGAHGPCACGNFGCLQTVASGSGILRRLGFAEGHGRMQGADYEAAVDIFEHAAGNVEDQPHVPALLKAAGAELGRALAIMALIVAPDVYLLTGFVASNRLYRAGVEQGFYEHLGCRHGHIPTLEFPAAVDDDAPVALALHEFVFKPQRGGLDRLAQLTR